MKQSPAKFLAKENLWLGRRSSESSGTLCIYIHYGLISYLAESRFINRDFRFNRALPPRPSIFLFLSLYFSLFLCFFILSHFISVYVYIYTYIYG